MARGSTLLVQVPGSITPTTASKATDRVNEVSNHQQFKGVCCSCTQPKSSSTSSNRCHHQKSILQKRSSSKKVSSASSIKNSLVSCSFMTNRKSQNFFDLKSRKIHPINYLLFTSIRGGQAWCWVMNLSGTRGTVTISKKITKKHHQMSTQKEKVFSISNRSNMTLSI